MYKDDFGIDVKLGGSVGLLKLKLDLGGAFVAYQQTTWHISGTFQEKLHEDGPVG